MFILAILTFCLPLFCIKSKACTIIRPLITDAKSNRDSIMLSWKRIKGASGYTIYQLSDNNSKKLIKVKSVSKNKTKINGLRSGTKYRYKMRAFKKEGRKKTYSSFSKTKTIRTKYGLSKNFFSCKAYEVKFDEEKWKPDLANGDSLNINYLDKETSPASIWIQTIPLSENEIRMTLEEYIQNYIEENSELYYHPIMKNIGYRQIGGWNFIGIRDLSNPIYKVDCIAKAGDNALFISVECNRDNEKYREDIDGIFSKLKLKKYENV